MRGRLFLAPTALITSVFVVASPLVAMAAVTPTLGTLEPIAIVYGSVKSIPLTPPTSDSPGSWTFTSSNTSVAIVQGSQLIPVGIGTATLTATQAAINTGANEFASASRSSAITISKGKPVLGPFADQMVTFNSGKTTTITLSPPASTSSGAWTFISQNQAVATIKGNIATILSLGIAPIVATQAASTNFNASDPVTMLLQVVGPAPTIGSWPALTKVYTDQPFTLTPPTSQSNGKWSYSFSKAQSVLSQNGNLFTIVGVGSVSITGTQEATTIYGPGSATLKITVNKALPTVGQLDPISVRATDPAVELNPPTSNSDGGWSFTSSDKTVAVIKNGKIQGLKPGKVTVTAAQGEGKFFLAANPVTTMVTVTNPPIPPTIPKLPDLVLLLRSAPLGFLAPKNESTGEWTLESSNAAIVALNGNQLSPVSLGDVTITATQAPAGDFAGAKTTFLVSVQPKFNYSVIVKGRAVTVTSANSKVIVQVDGKKLSKRIFILTKGNHRISLYLGSYLLSTNVYKIP